MTVNNTLWLLTKQFDIWKCVSFLSRTFSWEYLHFSNAVDVKTSSTTNYDINIAFFLPQWIIPKPNNGFNVTHVKIIKYILYLWDKDHMTMSFYPYCTSFIRVTKDDCSLFAVTGFPPENMFICIMKWVTVWCSRKKMDNDLWPLWNWATCECDQVKHCVCNSNSPAVHRRRSKRQMSSTVQMALFWFVFVFLPRMPQWSRIRRFPETILFSSIAPAGISIRSPWLAMMMTVPFRKNTLKLGYGLDSCGAALKLQEPKGQNT